MVTFSKILNSWLGQLLIAISLILPLCSCTEADDYFDTQDAKIVSFLTASHSPILIAEEDVQYSPLSEPNFYTKFLNSSYRYIRTYYDSDRDSKSEVTATSTITITFWMYDFSSYTQPTTTTLPFYTNDSSLKTSLEAYGLDTDYWDFTPLEVNLSTSDIIIGARKALVGCREGDFVELYMTYNVAYGDSTIGVIEEYTPIAMFIQIESVE